MSTGDGLACVAMALAAVGMSWAGAWAAVRNTAMRAEALRRLGEGAWTQSKTTTPRRAKS